MNLIKSPCMPVCFSELCKKEVVNTCDGCRLGYISDIELDAMCGRINCVFVPVRHKLFAKCHRISIRWDQIERIGSDMVLVRLPKKD